MAKEKGSMIRLGLFVTLAVALFISGIYYLGNSKNMFGETFTIHADFRNVNGLQYGSNVRFSGISVGSVNKINILNDTTLRVDMRLQKDIRGFIKKDAIASIGTDGLVGSTLVNINPSRGESPPVEDNDIIQTYSKLETEEMLQSLGTTSENIALLSLSLLEVSEKINEGKGMLGTLLNDEQLTKDIQRSVKNIKKAGSNLVVMSDELTQTIALLKDGEGLLGYLLTDSTFMPRLENMVARVDTVIDEDVEAVFVELKKSVEEINAFGLELRKITEDINSGKGTVGTLLKDEATDLQVQEILSNVNEGTLRLNENLEALRHNWFFRRYFKKKAKAAKKAKEKELSAGH